MRNAEILKVKQDCYHCVVKELNGSQQSELNPLKLDDVKIYATKSIVKSSNVSAYGDRCHQ